MEIESPDRRRFYFHEAALGQVLIDDLLQPFGAVFLDGLPAGAVHAGGVKHFQTCRLYFATLPLAPHERPK